MRVLLAGATGYLGSHIAKRLGEEGHTLRVLVRNKKKWQNLQIPADEIYVAEITNAKSIEGCCVGVDAVISTIGITRQKDHLTYMNVDYQGNLNLLREAQKSGVRRFIYVFVAFSERMRHLKLVQAKALFAEELIKSGLSYCVVKPNGFFPDMAEFLKMAKQGTVYMLGKGNHKINPIDGRDLAVACVETLEDQCAEMVIGGPEVWSYREIGKAAFRVLNKPEKIRSIPFPRWLRITILTLLRIFTPVRIYGPIEFMITTLTMDMVAPQFGHHTLEEYFRDSQKE
jgi:uncharacterized protein YbjT (DUF2867 family)